MPSSSRLADKRTRLSGFGICSNAVLIENTLPSENLSNPESCRENKSSTAFLPRVPWSLISLKTLSVSGFSRMVSTGSSVILQFSSFSRRIVPSLSDRKRRYVIPSLFRSYSEDA